MIATLANLRGTAAATLEKRLQEINEASSGAGLGEGSEGLPCDPLNLPADSGP